MSEYASGLTFGQTRNLDKERIRHALRGELVCGEDENGFIYAEANREDCERFILSAYDDCVYQAKQAMDSGRALERLLKSKGVEIGVTYTLAEYMAFLEKATLESDDYLYEKDNEEKSMLGNYDAQSGVPHLPPRNAGIKNTPDDTPRTIVPPLTNGGTLRSMDNRQLAAWLTKTASAIADCGALSEDEYFRWLGDPTCMGENIMRIHKRKSEENCLKNRYGTRELVDELKRREDVETEVAEAYHDSSVRVSGPRRCSGGDGLMKVFIAGPINGNPDYKANFKEAAEILKEAGYEPLNPATLPASADRQSAIRVCFAMLDAADYAYFLPGWESSEGARLERMYCEYVGKRILTVSGASKGC